MSLLPALRTVFPHAERAVLHGSRDIGDFTGLGDWILEAKATRAWDPAGFLKEAIQEAKNAKKPHYAVVIKRRGTTNPAAQYVLTDLKTWLEIAHD